MNKYGCCTQALVFPRAQVPNLIAYLTHRNSGQTDTIIEECADEFELGRYALAPQVVQHIGLVSSRYILEITQKAHAHSGSRLAIPNSFETSIGTWPSGRFGELVAVASEW